MVKMKPWMRVFKSLVQHNPMLYKLNRVMYDEKIAQTIDKLTTIRLAGVHKRLCKELGLESMQFKRLLSKFEEYNFKFTANIRYFKVGLLEYLLFIKDKYIEYEFIHPDVRSWLRFYTKVFMPRGTLLTIYIPYEFRNEITSLINKWLSSLGVNWLSSFTVARRLQPSFTKHEPSNHPLYRGYTISELEEIFSNSSESRPNWFISDEQLNTLIHRPYDVIDLLLIKELELDALIRISTISQGYVYKMKTLRKHLVNHIVKRNVIDGIYLKLNVFIEAFGSPLLLILKVSDRKLYYKWINFFISLENTLNIAYSPYSNEDILYIVLSKTYRHPENLKNFLISKASAGLIEELIPLEYTVGNAIRYSIPYKNFDQDMRNWSIDLDSAHRKIDRRVFKK